MELTLPPNHYPKIRYIESFRPLSNPSVNLPLVYTIVRLHQAADNVFVYVLPCQM